MLTVSKLQKQNYSRKKIKDGNLFYSKSGEE